MISIPAYLTPLLRLFSDRGEEAFPVGGCVRDALMGLPPHDWDVAVTTPPYDTMALCHAAGYRTVPTGLKHGTITVLLPLSGDPSDREGAYDLIECTTCRTEGGYSDGRHPDAVTFTGRIRDDLSRRDFTVNAMALTLKGGTPLVLDPFGGQNDLKNRLIRAVGDPDTRFKEDALRLLRGVRFAVRLGFSLEEETYAAMSRCAPGLSRISRERIGEEMQKLLTSPEPDRGVVLLTETGLMDSILPHSSSPQTPPLPKDALASLPRDLAPRLACLLWGREPSAVDRDLLGLRLPNALQRDVLALLTSASLPVEASPSMARKWRYTMDALTLPALSLRRACVSNDPEAVAEVDDLTRLVKESLARQEPVRISELAIGGGDLLALGFPPGRGIGELLQELAELVREDPTQNTPQALLREALKRKG